MTVSDDRALSDIASALFVEVTELDLDMDLRDQGMDSVRIMDLVQRWREAGLEEIDFIRLAEDQRISQWLSVLRSLQSDVGADS